MTATMSAMGSAPWVATTVTPRQTSLQIERQYKQWTCATAGLLISLRPADGSHGRPAQCSQTGPSLIPGDHLSRLKSRLSLQCADSPPPLSRLVVKIIRTILLTVGLIMALSISCNAAQPKLPDCPESFYDSENTRINYVHDNGDGEFYLIQLYIEIENAMKLLPEFATNVINPFTEVEIGDLMALATDAQLDANLDISPCRGER